MKSIVPAAIVCLIAVFLGPFVGDRNLHAQSSVLRFETVSIKRSDPAADSRKVLLRDVKFHQDIQRHIALDAIVKSALTQIPVEIDILCHVPDRAAS